MMPKLFVLIGLFLSTHTAFSEVVLHSKFVLYHSESTTDARCAENNPLKVKDYPLRDEFAYQSLMLFSSIPVKDLPNQQKHHIKPIEYNHSQSGAKDCSSYLDTAYQTLKQAMIDNQIALQSDSDTPPILWDTVGYLIQIEKRLYPSVYHAKQHPEKGIKGNKENMIGFKKAINQVFANYPEMQDYWLNRITLP